MTTSTGSSDRELFQEAVDGIAVFEMIEQTLDRHACLREARCAVHDLRIDRESRVIG